MSRRVATGQVEALVSTNEKPTPMNAARL